MSEIIDGPLPGTLAQGEPVRTVERDARFMAVMARVLSERALGTSHAVLVFVMGAWAMWQPTPLRAAIAGGFAVFVVLVGVIRGWMER